MKCFYVCVENNKTKKRSYFGKEGRFNIEHPTLVHPWTLQDSEDEMRRFHNTIAKFVKREKHKSRVFAVEAEVSVLIDGITIR